MTSTDFIAAGHCIASQHLAQCLYSLLCHEDQTVAVWRQSMSGVDHLLIQTDHGWYDCGDERSLHARLVPLPINNIPQYSSVSRVAMAALPASHLPMLLMQYNHFDHL
ncbi:hypothetical protein [Shewanella sp. NIFS-20-20]|uniref:hypothetical protein n=1 Tax=Shewanella sp. NIFS-20-20 TaxID=2853806 RepID=UPI001C484AC2|nr:hypothetical protein [Shewanella sp. NIFS-20-20]MBV7316979.1 hypothetical protein [Shewanella sp. NIFS-20-20]